MINVETMMLMKLLDKLALLTTNGIEEFGNATESNQNEKVFYDEGAVDENGEFKIVLDACVIDNPDCRHHDIISYYESNNDDYTLRVHIDEDDNIPFIKVKFMMSDSDVVIEKGYWYFA